MATLTAGGTSTATLTLDAFASVTVVSDASCVGTLTFTSDAQNLLSNKTLKVQNKTYGPFGVPGALDISIVAGSATYTINGNTGGFSYDASGNITGRAGVVRTIPFAPDRYPVSGQQITSPSKAIFNFGSQANTLGLTNCTESYDKTITGFHQYVRAIAVTDNLTSSVAKGSQSLTLDADDLLLQLDLYLGFAPTTGQYITITITNSSGFSANNIAFSFDSGYLKMGWNSLRCWDGDDGGASGEGSLAYGMAKVTGGAGCDMSAAIGRFDINFVGMNGQTVYLDAFRRGCKTVPTLVMGFDSTGTGTADNVFTEKVAPLFKSYGFAGYFTVTYIYDMVNAGNSDYDRKHILYNTYGWDALNHLWNHGVTKPGSTATVTLSRTSNVVTATWGASHGYTISEKFYAYVSGATPSDMNGLFEVTPTTTTAATYSATGANGSGTGTIQLSTLVERVCLTNDSTTQELLRHEICDMARYIKAEGWHRASHIGAWPNNSVPHLTLSEMICGEAGIRVFRSKNASGAVVSEPHGVVNPLHIGSVEMGSGTTATTLQNLKDKLRGCVGRGEAMWTYGHFILDDTDPANYAYAPVDDGLPPGSGSNPAPPSASLQGGIGGWWYYSTLRRFLVEAVLPYMASDGLKVMTPSEWAAFHGIFKDNT